MIMDSEYKQAVLDLYLWQHKNSTSFSAHIFVLIGKADFANRFRIEREWPTLFKAWSDWNSAPSSDIFFQENGIGILTE